MRSISSCWDWLLTPGSELGETQRTVLVGAGLMKQPGTTLTGLQELRMIPVVMKTVSACSRIIIRANGMIKNAAIGEILFARKVWNLEFLVVGGRILVLLKFIFRVLWKGSSICKVCKSLSRFCQPYLYRGNSVFPLEFRVGEESEFLGWPKW